MSSLELLGNILNVLSVVLASYNRPSTWTLGILGCLVYGKMFYDVRLFADVTLQLFFIVTSLWGIWHWKKGGKKTSELLISKSSLKNIGLIFIAAGIGTLIYGTLLNGLSEAAYPFWDSLILFLSIGAQFLMMKRKIEHWYFWIAVNIAACPLYWIKDLKLTSLVYAGFLINAFFGLYQWKILMRAQSSSQNSP